MSVIEKKRLIRNVSSAMFAQSVSIAASLFISLIVPRYISAEEYGYWQLFIFYSSYVGILLFGADNGIYLINGGKKRDELNRAHIKGVYVFATLFELAINCVLVFFIINFAPEERQFILLSCCLYAFAYNIVALMACTFQAIGETPLYSKALIIEKTLFVLLSISLLVFRQCSYVSLIALYCCCKALSAVVYIPSVITIIGKQPFKGAKKSIEILFHYCRNGIGLLYANLASILVVGAGRFVIDGNEDISVFGEVSLALSISMFCLSFISQASMVLYPELNRRVKDIPSLYSKVSIAVNSLSPILLCVYFPVIAILNWWLPQYSNLASYVLLLMPLSIFELRSNLLNSTILKIDNRATAILASNVVAVMVTFFGAVASYRLFQTGIYGALLSIVIGAIVKCILQDCFVLSRLRVFSAAQMVQLSCVSMLFQIVLFYILCVLAKLPVVVIALVTVVVAIANYLINEKVLGTKPRRISG